MASIPILRDAARPRLSAPSAADVTERLLAAAFFVAVSPVLCVSALTLAVLSRRSPVIAHRRVGWHGRTLWMLKLRTMWGGEIGNVMRRGYVERIDDSSGPLQKDARDPRVCSAFARFCRRHSIDELPQLLHVIRGEMSLVGPRPLTASELSHYYGDDAREVLEAKPGIAGLWQVSGRSRLSYAERRLLDLKLVRNRTLRMYLQILARTAAEVWTGANSW